MSAIPPAPISDETSPVTRVTLIQRLRVQQDAKSWQEFVAHYEGYINRLARHMGLSHHDAQEVVQNVCLKAWQALPTFAYDPGKGRFRGWLWQVTANEVRMCWRNRPRETPWPENGETVTDAQVDPGQRPEEEWIEEEWRAHVLHIAWEKVSAEVEERTRQVFERLSKGQPPQTVAAELGLALASVHVYKKRVQDRLRLEIRRLNELLD